MQSNRAVDSNREQKITKFLIKNLFKNNCIEITDKEKQIAGIDIIKNNKNIDLKSQCSARYINHPTNTFILELLFFNRNLKSVLGWFLNSSLKTDAYGFCWVHKADKTLDNIELIEYMEVDVQLLKNFIFSFLSKEEITLIAQELQAKSTTFKSFPCQGIHFSCSPQLWESPVNLVVNKNILKQFAIQHCFIDNNGIITEII